MSQQKYEGLTDVQVSESRKKNGVNVLTPPLKDPWWKEFLKNFLTRSSLSFWLPESSQSAFHSTNISDWNRTGKCF